MVPYVVASASRLTVKSLTIQLESSESFTHGSLYLGALVQAGDPHIVLILAMDNQVGYKYHIRVTAETPYWHYEFKREKISNNMVLSTLLRIHDVSAGALNPTDLDGLLSKLTVPVGREWGECFPWVIRAVQALHDAKLVSLVSTSGLREELEKFASGNRAYARRDLFPNTKVSEFCA